MKFKTFLLESNGSLDVLEAYLLDPLNAYKITLNYIKRVIILKKIDFLFNFRNIINNQ